MAKRTTTVVKSELTTTQRVAVGLIAVSLSLSCLAFGVALFASPGANWLFVPTVTTTPLPPSTASAVTLTWKVPGNNGLITQPISYDLRYSTTPLTEQSFSTATAVPWNGTPAPIGATETVTVTGLQPATTYFFVFRATDDAGHISAMSTVTAATTADLAQACVPAYSCSEWSACSAGVRNRTCSPSNDCPGGLDEPLTTQSCTGPAGEPVRVVNDVLAIGVGAGGPPVVQLFNPATHSFIRTLTVFDQSDTNGVNVATGDLTGDHQVNIVAGSGIGSAPLINMYTAAGTLVASFDPYPTENDSGVTLAVGDLNGDGVDELLTMPAASAAQVRVWEYHAATNSFDQLAQAFAFDRTNLSGFTMAAGDVNNDGRAEVVVAPRASGKRVVALSMSDQNVLQELQQFTPTSFSSATGFTVAIGDVFGNGRKMVIIAPTAGSTGPIELFNERGLQQAAFFGPTGRLLLAGGLNRDGRDELLMVSERAAPAGLTVERYSGLTHQVEQLPDTFTVPPASQPGRPWGGL